MDDESHPRLRIILESLLNQTTVNLRFSKRRSLLHYTQNPQQSMAPVLDSLGYGFGIDLLSLSERNH